MEDGIKQCSNTAAKVFCVLPVIILLGVVIAILIRATKASQIQAENARMRGKLSQIRLALSNFETVTGHPLPRLTQTKNGRTVSWRARLTPYFHDNHDKGAYAELLTKDAPVFYRTDWDKSDPTWTSVVAVYDPEIDDSEIENTSWAIVAMAETGIPWQSPRDITLTEFTKILAQRDTRRYPIAVISASGERGSFIDNSFVLYLAGNEENLKQLLFR